MNYWFFRLKGFQEGFSDPINIQDGVFEAENRDEAKKYLCEKFGKLPFRKPKNCIIGMQYLWLTESDQYWYDYHNSPVTIECKNCHEKKTIIGKRNLFYYRDNVLCSKECKEEEIKKYLSEWISEEDHVLTSLDEKNEELIGYVYKITDKRTMDSYVGQTVKPPLFRWWQHLKNGRFEDAKLTDLVFEVLEVVTFEKGNDNELLKYKDGQDKLNKREAYYIELFDCVNEGLNAVQPLTERTLFTEMLE